jgi:hypothetical protein
MEEQQNPKQEFNEFIESCTEHELFFVIDEAGAFIWRMNHLINNQQIPEADIDAVTKDIVSVNKMQGIAAENTKRFGVNFELVEQHNEIMNQTFKVPCPEYWAWLKHWNEWKNAFTDESWDAFIKAVDAKGDLTEYLPKKRWNE